MSGDGGCTGQFIAVAAGLGRSWIWLGQVPDSAKAARYLRYLRAKHSQQKTTSFFIFSGKSQKPFAGANVQETVLDLKNEYVLDFVLMQKLQFLISLIQDLRAQVSQHLGILTQTALVCGAGQVAEAS